MNKTSVGESIITPFKQEDIMQLLSKQIGNAYGVWRKCRGESFYKDPIQNIFIDASAGDMNLSKQTSPRTFITTLRKFRDYPARLCLIEKEQKTFNNLVSNFNILNEISGYTYDSTLFDENYSSDAIRPFKTPPDILLVHDNMQAFLSKIEPCKYRYGLIYFDPNGYTLEDYIAVFNFLRDNPRVDVILNINVTQVKRNRSVKKNDGFNKYHGKDLIFLIDTLSKYKSNIFVRNNITVEWFCQPQCRNHFILLFATNNRNFVMPGTYNFVSLSSQEGTDLVFKYNYTKNESTE